MNVSQFFWIIPFLCFITGYYAISRLISVETVIAPHVVGLVLHDALKAMASHQLHGQIIAQKEEADLPDGLVLDQTPLAGQQIKVSQPMYLTISCKPQALRAPNVVGMQKEKASEAVGGGPIRLKFHEVESNFPLGQCIAQTPVAGAVVTDGIIDLYISTGMTTTRIFPSCIGLPVPEVQDFCKQMGMAVQLFHRNKKLGVEHGCELSVVKEQKPLPGTLFDMKKPLIVQLIVE